jgi:hypothetical protein
MIHRTLWEAVKLLPMAAKPEAKLLFYLTPWT